MWLFFCDEVAKNIYQRQNTIEIREWHLSHIMMKIMGMKDLWKRFKATFALVDNPELMHPHGSSTSWRQEFHKGVSCVQNRTASQSEGCHHIVAVYSMYSIAMIIKAAKQEEKKQHQQQQQHFNIILPTSLVMRSAKRLCNNLLKCSFCKL